MARLSASVPLEVKKIRPSVSRRTPMERDTCLRDSSRRARALSPAAWVEEGLPQASLIARETAQATSGSGAVVAELSM